MITERCSICHHQCVCDLLILATLRSGMNLWGVREDVLASTVGKLDTIHCPTLILWGKQDAIFPAKLGERAQRTIPQATLRLFEQCGHNPQVEQCHEFHRQVLDFLAKT
jgi:pimeloyl-ACP methyl ester carboxylesterase